MSDPYRWHDIEWTLAYSTDEQLRSLVCYQAAQIDRLTGGYEPPPVIEWDEDDEPEPPSPEVVAVVEALLWRDDIYRKPPRVAAPRLLEELADAGLTISQPEDCHTP